MSKHGWTYKKLGELTTTINGLWTGKKPPFINVAVVRNTNFTKDCKLDMTNVAFLDVEQKQYATRKLYPGDIIIEKSGGSDKQPVGRPVLFNISDGEYSFSNFTSTLRLSSNDIIPSFLHKVLYAKYLQGVTFRMQSKTTGIHNLDFNAYKRLQIPVPGMAEQEAIVAELDEINEAIAALQQQVADLDTLARATFYDMFGDPVTNPKAWPVKKWEDVLTIINGKNQREIENANGQYPICGSGGIMGYGDSYLCPEYTTIIGRKGNINSPIYMKEKFWNVDTAFGLVANTEVLMPIVLFYFCVFYDFETHNVAVTIPSLRKADLLKINIPIPSLALQQEFAAKVEAIEAAKAELNAQIAEMQTLLASRMDYYFD